MEFSELVLKRQSCRDFSDKPIPNELLYKVVEMGHLSPSAKNKQPWHLWVSNNDAYTAAISAAVRPNGWNKHAEICPAFIVVCEKEKDLGIAFPEKIEKRCFRQIDVGLVCAHLCMAASELGLSTCMLGMFSEAELRSLLNIPKEQIPRIVIAVGYARTDDVRVKMRQDIREVATFLYE